MPQPKPKIVPENFKTDFDYFQAVRDAFTTFQANPSLKKETLPVRPEWPENAQLIYDRALLAAAEAIVAEKQPNGGGGSSEKEYAKWFGAVDERGNRTTGIKGQAFAKLDSNENGKLVDGWWGDSEKPEKDLVSYTRAVAHATAVYNVVGKLEKTMRATADDIKVKSSASMTSDLKAHHAGADTEKAQEYAAGNFVHNYEPVTLKLSEKMGAGTLLPKLSGFERQVLESKAMQLLWNEVEKYPRIDNNGDKKKIETAAQAVIASFQAMGGRSHEPSMLHDIGVVLKKIKNAGITDNDPVLGNEIDALKTFLPKRKVAITK